VCDGRTALKHVLREGWLMFCFSSFHHGHVKVTAPARREIHRKTIAHGPNSAEWNTLVSL